MQVTTCVIRQTCWQICRSVGFPEARALPTYLQHFFFPQCFLRTLLNSTCVPPHRADISGQVLHVQRIIRGDDQDQVKIQPAGIKTATLIMIWVNDAFQPWPLRVHSVQSHKCAEYIWATFKYLFQLFFLLLLLWDCSMRFWKLNNDE